MRASRVAVVAALVCTLPPVTWGVAQAALTPGDPSGTALAPAVVGLWLTQAACTAALLPPCVTLCRLGEAAAGVTVFVVFPLPALVLAWLAGAHPAHTLIAGTLLLAGFGALVLGIAAVMTRVLRGPVSVRCGLLLVQIPAAIGVLALGDIWLGWAGV